MKLETSRISLFLFLFALLNICAFAQVQVGTGTTTEQALPIEPYFGYSYSQVIYLSSEINAPGDITELQWYFAGNSLSNSNNWTIYMGHTSKSSFTSTTDWVAVGSMTQVFSGTFTDPGAAGWITFDITDFYYNGTDNLVIAIDENASGYNDNSDDFYCTSTTAGRSIVYYNDGTNPDPSSPPPGNTKSYIANIIFGGIPQDCPYPTTQIETNVSTTQADLGWTENGTATTWNIEWGPTGFTQGSGTMVTGTTSNPHTLSGLTVNTIYDWYVQADCGGDESAWIGPSTFTTPCNPFTATFAEGFDGVTTPDIPDCWSSIVNTSSSYPAVETTTSGSPNSTPNHIYLSNYGDVNATLMLITPPLSDLTSQSNQIRFWAKGSGEALIVGTMSDPANEATFTSYTTINFTNAYTYTEYTVMFGTAYTGTDEYIAFKLGSGNSYTLYIDDFNYEPMPSCPPPAAQTESGILATSADLGWTENGTATTWNIEWGATGFTQGSGTMITGTTTNPHTLTGLTATTTYDWYVQADCGSRDESGWIGPSTFTTPCDPFTATFAEGFDGVTTPDLPDCWSSIVNSAYSSSKVETTSGSPQSAPNHVQLYNYADASATLLLITPLLSDLTSQSNQIRFWGKSGFYSCDLIVGTMSNPTDEATFTSFTTISLTSTYTEYVVMFGTTYTGSDEYIAFKHGLGGTYLTLLIDDFNYEPMPTCPPPTSQTETNVSETQADLGWTENGTATTWNIEWGPAGFTQGSGTMITETTTNPHSLTGLTVNTLYDWYVQADCDGTRVESSWVGPKTFLTVVPVQSIPFIETWESGPPIGTAWNYYAGSVSSMEVNEASKHSGTYGLEQYGDGTSYWTPTDLADAYTEALPGGINEDFTTWNQFSVDLSSASTPWLTFWYGMGYYILQSYNNFWVQVSTDGSIWTDLLATNSSGSNSYEKKEYDLSTYNGTSQLFIRFFHNGKYDLNYLWLDDIRVQEDICAEPSDQTETNITTTSADLGWNKNGTATVWNIEWGPTGFTQGSGTMITGTTTNPHTISGLSPATTYDWWVQSDCGGDQSDWIGPNTFTTVCDPFTETFAENFDGVTEPNLPNCWSSIVLGSSSAVVETTTSNIPVSTPNHIKLYNSSSSSATLLLIAPQLSDLTSQSNQIRFWAKGGNGYDLIIGTMSNPADETTFTSFTTISLTGTYTEYVVMFGTTYTGSDEYIAFKHGLGGTSRSIYIDDFNYEPMPSCPPPTAQTESGISATSADLGWTENGTATTWNIEWGPTGFTQGSGTMVTGTTTNPHSLTGLTASTTYDWYVQADCGSGDQSTWVGPGTFTTACDPFTATFEEDFDDVTAPVLPDCWSSIVNSSSLSAYVKTTTASSPNSTPNHVRLYNQNDASATLLLITPPLSDLTSQSNQIRFLGKSGSTSTDVIVGTMSDPADDATFTSFTTISLTATYTEYTVMFGTTYTGSDEYIAFKHGLGGTYRYVYIDDFNYEPIPSCPPPTAQNETNITQTSVDLGWTENGSATTWNIEWGLTGFTQGSGTMVTGITVNPHPLSGLSDNTTYDWYVRADCGGGDLSTWIGPSTFSTTEPGNTCSAPIVITSLPYTTSDNTSNYGDDYSSSDELCSSSSYLNGDDVVYSYTPAADECIDITLTNTGIWVGLFVYEGCTPFTACVDSDTQSGGNPSLSDLSLTNGTTYYIIISTYPSPQSTAYDMEVSPCPTCPPPTAQNETNITQTSVDFGWTTGGASTWDIEWGSTGFTQGSGTMETGITVNPHPLSGLSAGTTYDWYIRDDCGGGDQSTWLGPSTFSTACVNVTSFPYTESFESAVPPDCWTEEIVTDNGTDPDWSYESFGSSPSCSPVDGSYMAKFNSFNCPSGSEARLHTNALDLTGLTAMAMSFWMYHDNAYSTNTSEGVQVQVSTDGSAWSDLGNFIQRLSATNGWAKHTFDLSAYDGQTIYVGFLGQSQYGNNIYIDGINIHNSAPTTATWLGGTDNDWSKDANWSTTDIPYPTTNVTIPAGMANYPTIFAAAECNNLTIESGAGGDGSILGDEYLTVNGTSTVQRYITGSTWHDLSASTQGQTVNTLYQGGSPDVWLRTYNEPDNSRTYITELTDPLDPGAGFEVWVESGPRYNITVDYTGTLQTTDVTLTTTSTPALTYSGTGADDPDYGYNLIGNPFASPIDLDEGTWNLTNVNTSFWVWDSIYTGGGSGSGDYRDWNSSSHVGSLTDGIVPMGQGFFIQANDASPSVTIPMEARVHSGQAYYKVTNAGNEDTPIHIKLRAIIGEGFSEMNIAFVEGASEEFDIYDTRKMFTLYGVAPQVYSEKAGEKLSINGLPLELLSEEGTVVNVGYRPGLDGMQTLEAMLDNLPNTEVFLEDKLIGNIQRLNDEPVYEFVADVGDDPNRFFLHFNPIPDAIGNPDNEDLILVYAFDDKLCIRSSGAAANYNKKVWIYDMFGRTAIHTNAAASTFTTIPLHQLKGYVVVRIISESGVQTNKVYIK